MIFAHVFPFYQQLLVTSKHVPNGLNYLSLPITAESLSDLFYLHSTMWTSPLLSTMIDSVIYLVVLPSLFACSFREQHDPLSGLTANLVQPAILNHPPLLIPAKGPHHSHEPYAALRVIWKRTCQQHSADTSVVKNAEVQGPPSRGIEERIQRGRARLPGRIQLVELVRLRRLRTFIRGQRTMT